MTRCPAVLSRAFLRHPRLWAHAFLLGLMLLAAMPATAQQSVRPPADATLDAAPPLNLLPEASDTDIWRAVRRGESGNVSIPNDTAGLLIQSEGDNWRTVRNGPYPRYIAYAILGMTGLIALFFALRGRVRIHEGFSGILIKRFNFFERATHWLTATSFVILALTGLNLVYGRSLLIPLLGKDAFASIAIWGKMLHNFTGFGFMAGIALMFVFWVVHNIPSWIDIVWLAKGGGLFGHTNPPSRKFNAGQKIIFWSTILGGLSLSLSGLQLLFPFSFSFFNDTFALANSWFGTSLPADLSPIAEQQLATLWHGAVGGVMTAIIIAHIYIGTLGMEGAFAAMGSGRVDLNWAREHHNLWVARLERERGAAADD